MPITEHELHNNDNIDNIDAKVIKLDRRMDTNFVNLLELY